MDDIGYFAEDDCEFQKEGFWELQSLLRVRIGMLRESLGVVGFLS